MAFMVEMILSSIRSKKIAAGFLLVAATFFWGVTFVTVKDAIGKAPVFVFLAQRFSIAFFFLLLPFPLTWRRLNRRSFYGGIVLGVLLFGGFAFQTLSLRFTTASNTAFLTGLNVVLVPVVSSMIFRKKIRFHVMLSALLAFAGLYLLCAGKGMSFNAGDLLGFICAVFIAVHIIFTGKYAGTCDTYWLTAIQIGVIGFLSFLVALVSGDPVFVYYPGIVKALVICVFFATIFAFLVQTTMQRYINASTTAVIFCMEPVFAALTAYVLTGERLGVQGVAGAVLIFSGMVLSGAGPGED
jgi:drug/metabolite transporter (DMT)-like permease